MAERAVRSGDHDLVLAVGFDKHPRGAFNASSALSGLGEWYGESGLMLTTQFFALKVQRYFHDHGLSPDILAKVAAKAFRNGAHNPNAWRRKAAHRGGDRRRADAQPPADSVHVLQPSRGRRGPGALPRRPGLALHGPACVPAGGVVSYPAVRLLRGLQPLAVARRGPPGPTAEAAAAAFEKAGIGPEDVDLAQLQDTESGAEIMHLAETGFCKDGDQEALIRSRGDRDRRSSPGQHRRRLPRQWRARSAPAAFARSTSACCSCAATPAPVRCRASREVAFTHVYGAPGLSACTVLSR